MSYILVALYGLIHPLLTATQHQESAQRLEIFVGKVSQIQLHPCSLIHIDWYVGQVCYRIPEIDGSAEG